MSRPNLILITCHDLGKHLGCYGIPSISTPNLDAFAAEGIRLARAFCVAPQCSPSRATLATGRYPHSNGVMGLAHGDFGWDLAPGEKHVAELLNGAGYETHLFGLQHVTSDVGRLGFDRVHGQGTGPEVASEVADFLRAGAGQPPFYVEVNFVEPHRPFDFGGVAPDPSGEPYVPGYVPVSEESRREFAALQGAIRRLDDSCGQILSALGALELCADTMVVFTADHGVAMPRAKCTLYDPGIEVALLVRWPNDLPGGRTFDALVSNVDVLPTMLEAAGVTIPSELQGHSFLPLLRGGSYEARAAVYAEKTWHSYYDPMRAVRTERFKLIRSFETAFAVEVPGDVQKGEIFRRHPELYSRDRAAAIELYDLDDDPLERHNLAGLESSADVQSQLDDRLWGWMYETRDPLLQGPIASPRFKKALGPRAGGAAASNG